MMDYLLFMPLGVEISRVFGIGPDSFGLLVSSYCISAGVSGLVAAFFLNSIPKVKLLSWVYAGFVVGTLLCALAPTYETLVLARCIAGLFGGLTAPIILALIGDLFPEKERGSAIGIFMLGFGLAAVAGVPFGLQLALHFTWRMPLYLIAGLGFVVWMMGLKTFPRTKVAPTNHVAARLTFFEALKIPPHLKLIGIIVCLTFAQMVITPYISPFLVKNTGIEYTQLPVIFGIAGLFTLISAPVIGMLSDRLESKRVYSIINIAAVMVTMVFAFSRHLSLFQASLIVALLMTFLTGRFIVAMSVFTSLVKPEFRTSIFSFNSAIQQLATGIASYIGGLILVENLKGLENFITLACISVGFSILTSFLLRRALL